MLQRSALVLLVILAATVAALLLWSPEPGGRTGDEAGMRGSAAGAAGLDDPSPSGAAVEGAAGGREGRSELQGPPSAPDEALGSCGLRLRLVDPDGRPIRTALVRAGSNLSQIRGAPLRLARLGSEAGLFRSGETVVWAEAEPDESGEVVLEGLPADRPVEVTAAGAHWAAGVLRAAPLLPSEVRDLGDLPLAPGARIRGRVLDPRGEGAPHARVNLALAQGRSLVPAGPSGDGLHAECDATGSFEIPGVLPGRYALTGVAPGFAEARLDPLVVAQGGVDLDLELRLAPGLSARVRVVDRQGQPLAAARVLLAHQEEGPGLVRPSRDELLQRGTAVDAQGWVRLGGLVGDGKERVHATAEGFSSRASEPLLPGQEIELVLEPLATVTGQVLEAGGRVVAGARVELARADGPAFAGREGTDSEADGSFRFDDIEPGEYTLRAAAPSGLAELGPLQVAAGMDALEVRLGGSGSILVEVLDGAEAPLAEAEVVLEPNRMTMFQIGGEEEGPGGGRFLQRGSQQPRRRARTGLDGRVRFQGLTPGEYEVRVSKDGHIEVTRDVVHEEDQDQELRLVVPRAGGLRVAVLDTAGLVVPQAPLHLRALSGEQATRQWSTLADPQGLGVFDGLAPGEYALALGESDDLGDGLFLLGMTDELDEDPAAAPDDQRVWIQPGAITQTELVLQGKALPRVRVTRYGRPVAGARVRLRPGLEAGPEMEFDELFGSPYEGHSGVTDGSGWTELSPCNPGPYTVIARMSPGAPASRRPVELTAGPQEVVLELATGVVRGTVVSAGSPVPGAEVRLSPVLAVADGEEASTRSFQVMITTSGTGDSPHMSLIDGRAGQSSTRTAQDGTYVFEGVSEGSYRIEVQAPSRSPFESETFEHDGIGELDLGLHELTGAGLLTGTIFLARERSDFGLGFTLVQLESEAPGPPRFAAVGADGRYAFRDLPAGRYRLAVRLGAARSYSDWVEVEADRETPFDFTPTR